MGRTNKGLCSKERCQWEEAQDRKWVGGQAGGQAGSVTSLCGSHHVVEMKHYLSHLTDVAVCVSVFGGKDSDILEPDVMSQINAIPYHSQLILVIKIAMSMVLSDPSVN
jgi:hypothetical protein